MRDRFFLYFSISLWLLMVIGFSDNWLFDIEQESNSQPKFLVHAFLAFCWFTLLVIQSGLIRRRNVRLHMSLGAFGIVVYFLMSLTVWSLFFENFVERNDWMRLVKPLEAFSVALVTLGFMSRKINAAKHREYIAFGSFCLVGPALDRTAFHLFGPENMILPSLALYLGLFFAFVWFKKEFKWYMGLWVVFISFSLYPILAGQF